MTSLAKRNNNPLNLRPGQPYEGLANPSQAGGFCVFTSPVWGFRAVFRNYITKFDRNVNTIRALITEWAPPSDNNNTAAYIEVVCKKTGFGPDEPIALKTWDVCSKVCYAQAEVESGESFEANWTLADMGEGAYRAGILDAPPPVTKRVLQKIAGSGSAISTAAAAAEPVVSGWAGSAHSPNLQMTFLVIAGVLGLVAALVKK